MQKAEQRNRHLQNKTPRMQTTPPLEVQTEHLPERVCFNHSGIKLEISNQKKTRKSPNMYRFNNALINKPRLKKSQLEL